YKHTTMGFIRDVERMPEMYDYSIEFFHRYYRPENTVIVLAGEVNRDEALRTVDRHWGDWKLDGAYSAEIPYEPRQGKPKAAYVEWPTPTLPWILVGFKGPRYSDEQKDMPAMDLISNLAFAESSELYQRLVVQEQKVDTLAPLFEDHMDPYLVSVLARVKKKEDVGYVQDEILKTFESYTRKPVSGELLEAVKSHLRYGFALSMDNSQAIAAHVAPYIALRRDPETINRLYEIYGSISPEDIHEVAQKYFTDRSRTIVTLASNGR
ncbi:MAG: M16 family metallopeptidase, partial [Blastocatellia bacterium]